MKNKARFLFFTLVFCSAFALSGADSLNDRALIPAGHWIYDAAQTLAAEAKQTTFANAAPLSSGEIMRYLEEIPYNSLSSAGRRLYRRVIDYMNKSYPQISSGPIVAGIKPELNLSAFYKTDESSPWIYDYYMRKPLISVPLYFCVANSVALETDLYFGENYWTADANGNHTNIPLDAESIDVNFPKTSYISAGLSNEKGAFFNFSLGMGAFDIGNTQTGGIILSQYMTGASYAQASFFSPRLRVTSSIIELNVDRYLYLHRFEARPFPRFSIGIIEGVLVNAALELRFLNPVSVYHGMAAWRDYDGGEKAGSYFGVTAEAVPLKNVRLYGQFAMNQWQPSYEINTYGEAAAKIPNSVAAQGGAEYRLPIKNGYLYAGAEAVYTSPYMYILSGAGWSYYREWKELVSRDTQTFIRQWTGTPFGPDSYGFQVKAGYNNPGVWNAYIAWKLHIQGENAAKFLTALDDGSEYYPTASQEAQVKTPTGTPQYKHYAYITGEYEPLSWLKLGALSGIVWIYNAEHSEGQKSFSFEAAIYATVSLPYKTSAKSSAAAAGLNRL